MIQAKLTPEEMDHKMSEIPNRFRRLNLSTRSGPTSSVAPSCVRLNANPVKMPNCTPLMHVASARLQKMGDASYGTAKITENKNTNNASRNSTASGG